MVKKTFSARTRILLMLLSAWLSWVAIPPDVVAVQQNLPPVVSCGLLALEYCVLAGVAYALLTALLTMISFDFIKRCPSVIRPVHVWMMGAVSLVLLLLLLCVFGKAQSVDFGTCQMEQIRSGHYILMHPVFHTLLCGFLIKISGTVDSILVLQIAAFVCACLVMGYTFMRLGLPRVYGFVSVVLMTVIASRYQLMIIKDAIYVPFFMFLVCGLCLWCKDASRKSLVLIAIGIFGVGLIRYDGQLVILASAISLIFANRAMKLPWKPVVATSIVSVSAVFSTQWLVNTVTHAADEMNGTKWAMPASIICEIVAHNGDVTPEEMREVERVIMPKDLILRLHDMDTDDHGEKYIWLEPKDAYPYSAKYSLGVNLTGKGNEVIPLFCSLSIKNPMIACRFVVENAGMLWTAGRARTPENAFLRTLLLDVYNYICLPFIYMYPTILVLAYILRKKVPLQMLLPWVPVFMNALVIFAVATTYEVRYALPFALNFPILIGYSWWLSSSSMQSSFFHERGNNARGTSVKLG